MFIDNWELSSILSSAICPATRLGQTLGRSAEDSRSGHHNIKLAIG